MSRNRPPLIVLHGGWGVELPCNTNPPAPLQAKPCKEEVDEGEKGGHGNWAADKDDALGYEPGGEDVPAVNQMAGRAAQPREALLVDAWDQPVQRHEADDGCGRRQVHHRCACKMATRSEMVSKLHLLIFMPPPPPSPPLSSLQKEETNIPMQLAIMPMITTHSLTVTRSTTSRASAKQGKQVEQM